MNRIIIFIKEKKLLLLVTISLLSIILISSLINNGKNNKPAITKENDIQAVKYKDISTGQPFDEDKINELLDFPTESTTSGEIKINKYRSSNEYRTNELIIKNDEVDFIREVVNPGDNKNADYIRNLYGNADIILYEKSSNSYFDLYVYKDRGIAYLGHNDGGILEIWYFRPTNIDSFIDNYAPNYQKTPFTGQTGY